MLKVAGSFLRAEKDELANKRGLTPDIYEQGLLMRALRDFNVPKIVADDLIVFMGLIKDLFAQVTSPNPSRIPDDLLVLT